MTNVYGLTGGIGSGKSTVLALLKKKGAFVQDADAIVRELLDKDRTVRAAVKRTFGTVERKELARRVFNSRRERKILERILHPRVRKRMWSALRKKKSGVAVFDIPLLYESKWEKKLDGVIVVNASLKTRLARLKKRGVSNAEARRRIKAQMSLAEKARRADFVIDNNESINKTKIQVNKIWKKLTK